MKHKILLVTLLILFLPYQVRAQNAGDLTITSPSEGQVVQGVAVILGTATLLGFSSYELSFAYSEDSTQTWFVLHSTTLPVFEDELGTWDTTTLTDGDYSLRVQVILLNGTTEETIVSGLRVRNYTAVPTNTPAPTTTVVAQFAAPTAQLIEPLLVTVAPSLSTPTPFPDNPVELKKSSISKTMWSGAFLALLMFMSFGLLMRLRRD